MAARHLHGEGGSRATRALVVKMGKMTGLLGGGDAGSNEEMTGRGGMVGRGATLH